MSQQPKFRINPESLSADSKLEEVREWWVESSYHIEDEFHQEIWCADSLDVVAEFILDHQDGTHDFVGRGDRGPTGYRDVTNWLDLDDIEEVREPTLVEQKIIEHLGEELMRKVGVVREHDHTIEVQLKDSWCWNVPLDDVSRYYDTPKVDPSSHAFQEILKDLTEWLRGGWGRKLYIKPESLHRRDRLSEVYLWKVESNTERDGYTSGEVRKFSRLEDAVDWIKDHPDDDQVFYGMDDAGRRATTWLDLDDVEEVTE